MIVTQISIELSGINRFEYVIAKQGDVNSRLLQVQLLNNGKVYVLDDQTTARVSITKPDEEEVLQDCTINNNRVEILLDANILAAAGTAETEIVLTGSGGHVLTSATFDIVIVATNTGKNAESSSDYQSFKKALAAADNFKYELAVERTRIDNLARLKEGSTTGDAELQDIRIGINGIDYGNAGTAVRVQAAAIDEETRELNMELESAIDSGYARYITSEYEKITNSNIEGCVSSISGNSQAYTNGFVAKKECEIVGIKLHNSATSKTFSVFVFDSSNNLIKSYTDITPKSIENSIVTFPTPIPLSAGEYPLIRMLGGTFYYLNTGSENYKEYLQSSNSLIDSPIRAGFEIIYKNKNVEFYKENASVKPEDFILPKCKVANGEYTFIGRWFEKDIDGTILKCANADGSGILFKVTGSKTINVGLYAISETEYTPYFAYSVDGGAFIRQKITNTTITLPDNGEHIVWIVVDGMGENDPYGGGKWYGTVGVYFRGVTNGRKTALEYKNKQIMFVGDSIVEGINVLGLGANADVNSATNGFAFRTAKKLNSIPLMCGYGGTCTLGNASFHKAIEAIDYNMNGVLVNEQYPDLILIEHGYNDNSLVSAGTYTKEEFKTAYNKLLDRLKIKYSGVPIVCMIPFKQSLKDAIKECAYNRSYCYVIETDGWEVTYTDTAHLDVKGAEVASEELAKSIINIFGKEYFVS